MKTGKTYLIVNASANKQRNVEMKGEQFCWVEQSFIEMYLAHLSTFTFVANGSLLYIPLIVQAR